MAQFTGMITCHDAHMPRRVLDALWQLPQWQPMASSQFPSLSFHFFFFLFQNPSPFPYGLLYRRDWNFAIIAEKGKKNEAFNHPRLVLIFSSFSPDWKPSLAFRDEFSLPRGNIFFAKFRSSRSAPLSVKKKMIFPITKGHRSRWRRCGASCWNSFFLVACGGNPKVMPDGIKASYYTVGVYFTVEITQPEGWSTILKKSCAMPNWLLFV